MKTTDLPPFVRDYIRTLLWSGTEYAFGECPCCGKKALLTHYPEPEFEQAPMCPDPECGVREIANPDPLDRNYSEDDISLEALAKIVADCERFEAENRETLEAAIATGEVKCGPDFDAWGHAAHDLCLTRNHHGAGFWDGDWPEPYAQRLTDAAHAFGESNLYAGDDGKLYL